MTIQVIMPQMGESIFEGTLTKWLKKVGDTVARDEPLFEISTDKVDSEIPSPAAGILTEILVPEGKTAQINTVVAILSEVGSEAPQDVAQPQADPRATETAPQKSSAGSGEVLAGESPAIRPLELRTSPLVRKIAREHNIDLSRIRGTGIEGRITKEDAMNYLEQPSAPPAAAMAPEAPKAEAASLTAFAMPRFAGESETVPMSPMRKAIAEHMVFSKKVSAHVHTVFEVDVSGIARLRAAHKAEFEKREGVSLTYTPFFAKALVDTVREYPIFNSSVVADAIEYKKPVNLGIAVALDVGLIVPVIKNAHLKSFTGMALAIHDLAERARTRRLKPEDVQNGTISLTNPGLYGSLFGTPIISQPQVAILGIGGITKRAVVIDDAIAIRPMVFLSLTFDHRVIDGATADIFMASLKKRLQAWTQWQE